MLELLVYPLNNYHCAITAPNWHQGFCLHYSARIMSFMYECVYTHVFTLTFLLPDIFRFNSITIIYLYKVNGFDWMNRGSPGIRSDLIGNFMKMRAQVPFWQPWDTCACVYRMHGVIAFDAPVSVWRQWNKCLVLDATKHTNSYICTEVLTSIYLCMNVCILHIFDVPLYCKHTLGGSEFKVHVLTVGTADLGIHCSA